VNASTFATVRELPTGGIPALSHPEWRRRFPWLVQGTTMRGDEEPPFDLGLFSDASPPSTVLEHWGVLRAHTGFGCAVHAHQVHESTVRFHRRGPPGLHIAEPCDGHATADPGLLLAVSTADCVPVFIVDPVRRAVALVHAGWRGAAAGVLERGVAVLRERTASRVEDLFVHLGPAICGDCYEVGPEVFEALGLDVPDGPTPLDLRGALARRAVVAGVRPGNVGISAHCTLCGGSGLFSHRGGDRARQVGYLGIAP
jgi:hypothetical protein